MAVKSTLIGAQTAQIVSFLGQDAPLPGDLLAALKAELAGPAYAGQTPRQQALVLMQKLAAPNPEPPQRVPVTGMPIDQFGHILSDLVAAVGALPDDNPAKAQILTAYQLQAPAMALVKTVDFSGEAIRRLLEACVQSGAVSQAQVDGFTTQMDPAYKPTIVSAPIDTVAPGYVVTAADIMDALAS